MGMDLGALVSGFCVQPAADQVACSILGNAFEVFGEARASV